MVNIVRDINIHISENIIYKYIIFKIYLFVDISYQCDVHPHSSDRKLKRIQEGDGGAGEDGCGQPQRQHGVGQVC